MRTWSVSGTALALCTRSSSLSMSTRTSMDMDGTRDPGCAVAPEHARLCASVLRAERSTRPAVRVQLAEALGDGRGHQAVHVPAERRDLLDAARGDERKLGA